MLPRSKRAVQAVGGMAALGEAEVSQWGPVTLNRDLGFGREISLSSTGAPAIRLLLASRCPFIPAPERIWRRRIVELFVVLQCWAVEISRLLALPFEAYLGHIGPDDTVVR